ncbi:MAG: preprotein translocase subunit SecG [Candidatus Omnitrophota bacterium]|nr:preprotein translocase subunit SecG [Candidatus Omnitrophota bacterium]
MFISLIIVHLIVCLILIATILLQAGKGGGLTEAFGGGETAQSVFGTQTPKILKKATTVSAIVFLLTSLTLGMVTARRNKSLFDKIRLPEIPVTQTVTTTTAPDGTTTTTVVPNETGPAAVEGNEKELEKPAAPVEQSSEEKEGPISQ